MLLWLLSGDPHEGTLTEATRKDASLKRMMEPRVLDELDLASVLLHPRFSAVQVKSDGSLKVRPVDHLS